MQWFKHTLAEKKANNQEKIYVGCLVSLAAVERLGERKKNICAH